jgi:hypothetical protein
MSKLAAVGCGLALMLAGLDANSLRADDKVDLTGTWEFEIEIAGTQGSPVFTFKQEGEMLTGKYKGQFGDADVTGKVKDANAEFSFQLPSGGKVTYNGTIEKDGTMKGEANYDDQASGTWKAKRKPASKS